MTKPKTKSEVEHLRGVIKSLKSELRNIKKQLGRASKRSHQYEDLEQRVVENDLEEVMEDLIKTEPKCPQCGSVKLESVNLRVRLLTVCNACGYRKVVKKSG